MVKVKLMENRVNSHVGRVMVVNVMIQYKAPGRTRRVARITRARRPNVEDEALSTGPGVADTAAGGTAGVTLVAMATAGNCQRSREYDRLVGVYEPVVYLMIKAHGE